MKFLLFGMLMVSCLSAVLAQDTLPVLDKSPMDMSYYPVNYPILKIQNKLDIPLIARVIYGRPQKNNRVIFGDLVPYRSIWRLGANEATEIEFFKDVKINNKKIPKGEYTLYAIPDTGKWTLILNKETDTWGAFGYDDKKDVLRVDVPFIKLTDTLDVMTICFTGNEKNKTQLLMAWDNQEALLPISW